MRNALRQQFLQDPIDHLDFHQSLSSECERLELLVVSGSYSPSATRRILQEKSKGLCRQLVIPAVRDAIVLQCLSDALYRDIKAKEPTDKAFFEPNDHHFSKRETVFRKPDYGSYRAWLRFQAEIFRFSETRDYIVVTDVANYYDSIHYSHLRNIISDVVPEVRETILDMLIFVLSGLLWQPDYMPRMEIGLPQMNLDAPRILAHCFLFELDNYLSKHHSQDFVRFMDDIDVGVDSIAAARRVLQAIDLVLQTRHIRLNSGKTLILRKEEAIIHFRVKHNLLIDAVESRINTKVKTGVSVGRERSTLPKIVAALDANKSFDSGNGEKILKRLVAVSSRIGAELDDQLVFDALIRRPAMRASFFAYLSHQPVTIRRLQVIGNVLADPQIIDDSTFVNSANSLVESSLPSRVGFASILRDIINVYDEQDFFKLYCKFWIASKYSAPAYVFNLAERTAKTWRADPWLGRVIGGLYPVFVNSRYESGFRSLVSASGNPDSQRVYEFHDDLRRDIPSFEKSFQFLKAPNSSKRTGITHSKFLLLCSALANPGAPAHKRATLIARHHIAWADIFYRQRASIALGSSIAATSIPAHPVP